MKKIYYLILFIIFIFLFVFGCKSKEEPIYITRIGELTPGGGGIPYLEVYDSVEDKYTIYLLWFKSGTDTDTLPHYETVKIIGEERNHWIELSGKDKFLQLGIIVKSMEIIQPEE